MKLFGAAYPPHVGSRHIRDARGDDADAICAIHNEGIAERIATLDTDPRTTEERRAWLAARDPRHPAVVLEDEGRVIGWASLNVFNPREAYRHVADISVYVARGARGTGGGTLLLEELARRAAALGYHKLVLAAFPWNRAGMALYARCGFREVGVYREQGLLDGRWVDVVVMGAAPLGLSYHSATPLGLAGPPPGPVASEHGEVGVRVPPALR